METPRSARRAEPPSLSSYKAGYGPSWGNRGDYVWRKISLLLVCPHQGSSHVCKQRKTPRKAARKRKAVACNILYNSLSMAVAGQWSCHDNPFMDCKFPLENFYAKTVVPREFERLLIHYWKIISALPAEINDSLLHILSPLVTGLDNLKGLRSTNIRRFEHLVHIHTVCSGILSSWKPSVCLFLILLYTKYQTLITTTTVNIYLCLTFVSSLPMGRQTSRGNIQQVTAPHKVTDRSQQIDFIASIGVSAGVAGRPSNSSAKLLRSNIAKIFAERSDNPLYWNWWFKGWCKISPLWQPSMGNATHVE